MKDEDLKLEIEVSHTRWNVITNGPVCMCDREQNMYECVLIFIYYEQQIKRELQSVNV